MEDYFQAKRRLFLPRRGVPARPVSVINVDDPYGRRLAAEIDGRAARSLSNAPADYRAKRCCAST